MIREIIKSSDIKIIEPLAIEKRSFEIISERLKGRSLPEGCEDIIKRAIHTSADFDYADNLVFSEDALICADRALSEGATIVTDTQMAYSGINKKALEAIGCRAVCYMSDEEVAGSASRRGITRAIASMEKACSIEGRIILAIGNAPTALIAIERLYREGCLNPSLVIGVPVGFVNVVESKELIIKSSMPHIVARGNKGGSNVAAAICNALIYKAAGLR